MRAIVLAAVSSKAQAKEEKASVPAQLDGGNLACQRRGWTVVDTLIVDGHSRSYVDFYKMLRDTQDAGIDAYSRLMDHLEARDFDVLVVFDGSRLAREQASLMFIVSSVIQAGGRIFLWKDETWIDKSNYRMYGVMLGYAAANEVDTNVQKLEAGKNKKAERGLYIQNKPPMSHRCVYERGKLIAIEPNPDTALLIRDACTLVLEGVSWSQIENELTARYGYPLHTQNTFYKMFYNPYFWGHTARHFRRRGDKTWGGMWAVEPGHSTPEHVLIHYNRFAPALTGQLAEDVKAELARRGGIRGRNRPYRSHRFSGLLVCAYCGYVLNFGHGKRKQDRYWRCTTSMRQRREHPCTHYRAYPERDIIAIVDSALRLAIEQKSIKPMFSESDTSEDELIAADIERLDRAIRTLIEQQIKTPDAADFYQEKISELSAQLRALRNRQARETIARSPLDAQALQSVERIIDRLWNIEEVECNRILSRVLGDHRLRIGRNEQGETAVLGVSKA